MRVEPNNIFFPHVDTDSPFRDPGHRYLEHKVWIPKEEIAGQKPGDFGGTSVPLVYIIVAILVIAVLIFVVAVVVFIVQWVVACLVWLWQALMWPFLIYFLPIVLVLCLLVGFYWGIGIAMKNYHVSLLKNVEPRDFYKIFVRHFIITFLLIFQIGLTLAIAYISLPPIYRSGIWATEKVKIYYQTVEFPAYEIQFPFWDD